MSRARDLLVGGLLLLVGRRRAREDEQRIVPRGTPDTPAETAVILLLLACAACALAFVVLYALDRLPHQTQLLGAALGVALLLFAAALILIGKRLVVTEELEEPYPEEERLVETHEIERIVEESGSRITRRRLLVMAGGAAAGSLGLAAVTPAVSLGPLLDTDRFYKAPWTRGRRLVDEHGRPYLASDIEKDTFYSAYPEAADPELIGSPVVLVRLDPGDLHLPDGREHYALLGIVAYSKICTHAGCAISLYRKPTFAPVEPRPALVCPCHYSTFDPATGGTVLFGPAGRPLPQLPLLRDARGYLRAAGNFSGPVGPSWGGVREDRARA